jgi:hypothetical protein
MVALFSAEDKYRFSNLITLLNHHHHHHYWLDSPAWALAFLGSFC